MTLTCEYTNERGELCHKPLHSRFKHEGKTFLVIGPMRRGIYDFSAPFDVIEHKKGETRLFKKEPSQ